jgi:hypothetical protein
MGDSLTRFGINQLNHKLKVKKGGIEVTSGNISGSVTSTGSFGRVEAVSISGDGSAISNIAAVPWESTGSFYNAVSDIQITGSLSVLGNITGSFSGLKVGQKYLHAQSSAATTWTVSHNFDYQYVNVDVYDGNDQIVIPTSITATDSNTLTLTFGSSVSGNAIISTGGQAIDERGKNVVHNQSSAATNWRVTHSIGEQYPAVTVYDDTDSVIIPQQIKASDGSKMEIIFAEPVSGNANISVGGGLPSGAITSSAQIASDISGSFTDVSSSFSTRVSNLKTDSGSFSIRVTRNEATGSSLTTASSSFSTRVTRNEATGSSLTSDSGSFSTRITTNTSTGSILAGSGNIQGLGTTNSPTFVNVTATGTMTAQEFHTEFVSASIVYQSGSTKFGDTIDDIHSFTGSIHQSGSFNLNDGNMSVTDTLTATTLTGTTMKDFTTISGSVSSTGSFGAVSVAGMSNSNLVDVSSSLSTRVTRNEATGSSLTSASSSFSTRVTRNEATGSSLTTASSSLSTRVTRNEATGSSLTTASSSFSSRVTRNEATGSSLTTASSSFSTRVTRNEATGSSLSAASSSFSSRVTTNEGKATKGFTIAMSVAL